MKQEKAKDYSFRIRLTRSPLDTLDVDGNSLDLVSDENAETVRLCSISEVVSIKNSDTWVLTSCGWSSEADAQQAGRKYFDTLMLSLARIRIGVDFGFRHLRSIITTEGLRMLEHQTGQRMFAEINGVNIYETNPQPRFASSKASAIRIVPKEKLERVFAYALGRSFALSDRERLALELFNSSFFQKTVDTRFLLLVMAIESLLEPSKRSNTAINHVDSLIASTMKCNTLIESERASMLRVLEWLKRESIGQAGRKLAASRLGNRTYGNMTPERFFTHCYTLRSKMVHGEMLFPAIKEINSISGTLEVFVSDLLSGSLLTIDV